MICKVVVKCKNEVPDDEWQARKEEQVEGYKKKTKIKCIIALKGPETIVFIFYFCF